MVTQMLFGEIAEIIEEDKSWLKIRIEYDGYIGWVDKKQCINISEDDFRKIGASPLCLSAELFQTIRLPSGSGMTLVMGSSLPLLAEGKIIFSNNIFDFYGSSVIVDDKSKNDWLHYAMKYLNAPYLWGGRSPFGIDCSGFTQIVLKFCGVKLLRDASLQAEHGTTINMIEESIPRDLAFFENADGKITHVGIILDDQKIIHASGKVRIDSLDHEGIYNTELNKYTHKLRLIKRLF